MQRTVLKGGVRKRGGLEALGGDIVLDAASVEPRRSTKRIEIETSVEVELGVSGRSLTLDRRGLHQRSPQCYEIARGRFARPGREPFGVSGYTVDASSG